MASASNYCNNKVAKNTLYLYFRTLLVMGISIYTSRIILDVLGVEDYGIYNVVGGFVSMFSVLSGTLTAASQRFIAFELGKENSEIKKVFSTTVSIHVLLALVLFFLLESIGLWFLNYKMNITPIRLNAANWVFQCSVITFCVNIISIPYNAAIIAYEKMSAFAFISIFEVLAKLSSVYALYCITFDSLIVYAIFMLIIALTLRLIYGSYCSCYCNNCRYQFILDRPTFKAILGFCGWNFIGSTSSILNSQGINMLINLFFGVTLNAARGVSHQVDNALNTFVQNFMMALSPQITKSYAAKDFDYLNRLIVLGTKFAFFLFWTISIPFFFCADYLLQLWLKQVPDGSVIFLRCAIIYTLSQTLSQCLYHSMLATGNIKKYQIIVGGLSLLAFPTTFLCYKIGLPAEYGYISTIFFSLICLAVRIFLLEEMVPEFSRLFFFKGVILRCLLVSMTAALFIIWVNKILIVSSFAIFLLKVIVIMTISLIIIILYGITNQERNYILYFVKKNICHK